MNEPLTGKKKYERRDHRIREIGGEWINCKTINAAKRESWKLQRAGHSVRRA